ILRIVEQLGLGENPSGATIFINAATTLSAFGKPEDGLPLYARAARCYEACGKTESYEYAALLNNRANVLAQLRRWDEAEAGFRQAIDILRQEGQHDGDIALSLVSLAHLTFDRDQNAFAQVEALLDEAWEMLNSPRQARDGEYAFVLQKCAPSFDCFQRPLEAEALRDVAKEIYGQA
ncbi:MAG: tetratricopeptide repeat protein, partial [Clostridia bacterium]|nr:tetratricopeptide repeat protein [Clostridia bacterium]